MALTRIDLYWLPLGAGGHSVRINGRVFEWLAAGVARRDRCDLYHSALEVRVPDGRFVIETTPIPRRGDDERGVVGEGPVGTRAAGRFRLFRYEIRRWRDGVIPDLAEAVASPQLLGSDADSAERLLELVRQVPTPVWGRDELRAGEMWNSNSLISWLIVRSGLDLTRSSFLRVDERPAGRRHRRGTAPNGGRLARLHFEAEHHPALVVLRDVAIGHPGSGIRDVEEDVHGFPVRTSTVSFQTRFGSSTPSRARIREPARSVDVEWMRHGMVGIELVDEADLHAVADAEPPVDGAFSAPVSRSTSFQRMFAGVVIRLTSTMSSSHSMPWAESWPCECP